MLAIFKLLLPALIPSWRFFDTIAPSPRIEYALLAQENDAAQWQEFRPRPSHLSALDLLKRLFWNPRWNESLFLVSCAERLMQNPTEHSHQEILHRLQAELARDGIETKTTPHLQFRLAFLSREEGTIRKDIFFLSPLHPGKRA